MEGQPERNADCGGECPPGPESRVFVSSSLTVTDSAVHLLIQAGLHPWLDAQHRRYFIARDEHKVRLSLRFPAGGILTDSPWDAVQKIVAVCILAQIAHDSYQIKHAVTFVRREASLRDARLVRTPCLRPSLPCSPTRPAAPRKASSAT